MSDDYGAINGEQINFYAIDDGNVEVDLEAFHNFSFNQTVLAVRGRSFATSQDVMFDQAVSLRLAMGMASSYPTEFAQTSDIFQLYPIVVRNSLAIGLEGEIDQVAFNRWRSRARLLVGDDFRDMLVVPEFRVMFAPDDPSPEPRYMRATPSLRRIIVPPDPTVLVRQKPRMIPA